MVRVREIPRTAAFSWSPGMLPPLIATGTRAGAVDADFSNETTLELWDLSLDSKDLGPELLQPAAKIGTDSGFYDLAWTGWEDTSRGVIAGALQSGALSVWNADKLLNGDSEPLFAQVPRHSGPVKTLQFNPLHPNILATAGAKAEVYITNLNDVDSPVRLGNAAARPDDIDCLDWNKRVPHILVTGSNAGFVTVWDVKTKRESLTLNNLGRKAVSAVAWDPEKPTRLITSIPLETDPHILVWDLRNANAPERVLKGHDSGVLSLSWCRQDPSLLLSCGMDNRSLIWNPQTGENYGEFPVVTNWTFQTRFNPHNPNFFGTASFDGKIAIQTLQNTQNNDSSSAAQDQPVNDEDFFSHAQSQVQMSTFSLPKAPRWLERPVSASFGFGGRVIAVGLAKPGTRTSKITISKFEVDSDISAAADRFENALKEGDLQNICQTRAADAKSDEEKGDWKAIQALTAQDPRKQLIDYLGVSNELDEAADTLSKLDIGKEKEAKRPPPVRKHKRLQSMFDTSAESEQFFNEVGVSKAATTAVADDPFHIYTGSESDADRGITHALLFGKFDAALDICLKEDRLSDAFMVAICGGPRCIEKAQKEYLSKQASGPSYIRLLSSIAVKNLIDIVQNADLSNWKEVFATTCTFADDTQFPELCEILGDRLEELAKIEGHKESRRDASFCYIVSSKLDKAVPIWIEQLKEDEMDNVHSNPNTTSFSIHIHALQSLIEKVTIFRWATKYEDTEKDKQEDWKLSQLYETYLEYSNIVASHGRLDVAAKYLDLMPQAHPDAQVAKERIVAATRKPAPQPVQPEPAQQPKTVQTKKTLPAKPITQPLPTASSLYQPPMSGFSGAPVQPAVQATPLAAPRNPYSNIAAAAPANPYAQVANTPYQPTRPASIPPPPTQAYAPPASAAPVPPPPRASSQSPATHASASAWNDLPDSFIKPVAPRRGTPGTGPAVISSPFPGQSTIRAPNSPPVITSPAVGGGMAVPPPPKGPAPMRVASPPNRLATPPAAGLHPAFQPQATPPRNPYAPPVAQPPAMGAIPIPQIPRGPSPFAAPPAQPTPPNRYTPSPAPQNVPSPAGAHPFMPPRSSSQGPYTPSAQVQSPRTSNPYTPSNPPVQRYPPPPTSTISHSSQPSTSSQPEKRESLPPRHPPGDRSHISPEAQPIFDILSVDMQRVKARAPSSFKAQVNDTERRLNILFDHLNNGDLLKPQTVQEMVELAEALQNRDYATAHSLHLDILTNRTDECGNWMVGVKRLIGMSRATP